MKLAMRVARLVGVTGALAFAAGCASQSPPVTLRQTDHGYTAADYENQLRKWTRGDIVYHFPDLENRLTVDATFLSWDFRRALVSRYSEDANLSNIDRAATMEASLETSRQEHEFFVAMATTYTRWAELGRGSSAWRVALVDDQGREVAPVRVERYRRANAMDRTYFTYITPWRSVFRVHFPRRATLAGVEYDVLGPGTRYFYLKFYGPLGASQLRWDVAQGG